LEVNRRGVTLIEMVVVMAIIGVMAAIAFPAATSGLDSIRLQSAADSIASFLSAAMNRAERRNIVMEIMVDPKANQLALHSTEPGYERVLQMPSNVAISGEGVHRLLLVPGGTVPRFVIEINSVKGARKQIVVDPISGTPRILIPQEGQ
jgi:prepilin-type N-terminal cleavage/methylation domain-containing protein